MARNRTTRQSLDYVRVTDHVDPHELEARYLDYRLQVEGNSAADLGEDRTELSGITLEKRRLNALVPISCLPAELLAEIFMYVNWVKWRFELLRLDRLPCGSFHLSRVCHFWREVAMATPGLWTRFGATQVERTRNMLSLSANAPLQVCVLPAWLPAPTELVFDHWTRIEKLGIVLQNKYEGFPDSLPLLRSLICYEMSDVESTALHSFFPDHVNMPVLRELILSTDVTHWTSNLFCPTLTRLHVTIYPNAESLRSILPALATMPLLQDLSVHGHVLGVPDAISSVVQLQHLRQLTIRTPLVYASFLLEHVAFPSSASLQLGTPHSVSVPDDASVVLPTVVRMVAQSPTLSIFFDDVKFILWTSLLDVCAMQDDRGPPALDIIMGRPCTLVSEGDISKKVRTLVVRELIEDVDKWIALFSVMPDLMHLRVETYVPRSLMDALVTPLHGSNVDTMTVEEAKEHQDIWGRFLLPRLETLVIANPVWLDLRDVYDSLEDKHRGIWRKAYLLFQRRLAYTLRQRSSIAGKALPRLVLQSCAGPDPATIIALDGVVTEVEWDGFN